MRAEFVDCMGRHQKGGFVTEQAFIEYYADVNATLPAEKDDYFVDTVLKTWGLSASKVFVAPPVLMKSNQLYSRKSDSALTVQMMREKLLRKSSSILISMVLGPSSQLSSRKLLKPLAALSRTSN